MTTLNIRPTGDLDFLSLGALVHRLDPGILPFRKAKNLEIHVSGGECRPPAAPEPEVAPPPPPAAELTSEPTPPASPRKPPTLRKK